MSDINRLFVVLHKIYRSMERATIASGDLALPKYLCLLDAAELGTDGTRAQVVADVPYRSAPAYLEELEARELVKYARNRNDRRALSVVATRKGRALIDIVDEAMAVSLISASGKFDEATFERFEELVQSRFSEGEGRSAFALFPARFLIAFSAFRAFSTRECSVMGVSVTQMTALMILASGRKLSLGALSTMLDASHDILMLQMEALAARGMVAAEGLEGPFALVDEGRRRVDAIGAAFMARMNARSLSPDDRLCEFFDYLFLAAPSPKAAASPIAPGRIPAPSPTARPSGLAGAFSLLSDLFSYPSTAEVQQRTSVGFIETCEGVLENAGFHVRLPRNVVNAFAHAAAQPADVKAALLRREYTRLFYSYPRAVSLRGSDHVLEEHRSAFSLEHGERAAVGLEYRKLGLKNRDGVGTFFDDIVSELDFLAYLSASETLAIEAGDALDAGEWELLRNDFVQHHFRDLAIGVVAGVREQSGDPFLRFYVQLLDEVAARI